MSRLEAFDPQQGRIVELRFFGGLTIQETADVMRISSGTVKRDWAVARAWLYRELTGTLAPASESVVTDLVMPSAPTPEFWKRVKETTAAALERPEAERPAWIAESCAGDEALRREVLNPCLRPMPPRARSSRPRPSRIQAAPKPIEAAARASLALAAGRRIGPYRIVRELGHGGMGVVYLARTGRRGVREEDRDQSRSRRFPSELVLRRFRDERRILATLEHPNIATLLDGGTTDEGLPYVVMEYVDGVPLDVYCETAGLSLVQRLQLFRQVCAAVQFAHQRLVIHRDIKARNVLVTTDGTPKLLDFGIAKLLEPGSVPEAQTRIELRAFSLDGASPEQLRGEPMTVTSDVYALGVLLYELVTGRRPYAGTPGSDTDLIRAICDDPPARPRTAAREGTRFDVSDELEWVVLKALRKEPDRRYGSVEQLADDVRRLLGGLPVLAGPDSRRYRARKFVVRHRTLVAAGVLLTLSLLIGVSTTLWQARRAERQRALAEQRFQNARRVASSMIFELHDALDAVPGATAARALLLTRASEQLDALALDAPDDPVLLEELAVAYHRLGNVQGRIATPTSAISPRRAPIIARGSRCGGESPTASRPVWTPNRTSSPA